MTASALAVGTLVFEHAVFHPAHERDQRLVLFSPLAEADTVAKLTRLVEALPAAA